jgi:hypothetical protein
MCGMIVQHKKHESVFSFLGMVGASAALSER